MSAQDFTTTDAVAAPTTTADSMVASLETTLSSNLGVASLGVDGMNIRYDRRQTIQELNYWSRRAGAESNGGRPRVSRIKLD